MTKINEKKLNLSLEQGIAAHKEGKLKDAELRYMEVLHEQPTNPIANYNLGLIAISAKQTVSALSYFESAVKANPKIEKHWYSYISTLVEAKQFDNAKVAIEDAKKHGVGEEKINNLEAKFARSSANEIEANTPSEQQLSALLDLYQNARLREAEDLAVMITKKFPQHPWSWKVLGLIFYQTDRFGESLTATERYLRHEPNNAEGHSNLGATLRALGKFEDAIDSYGKAIELESDLVGAHYNLGITLRALGRLHESEESYKRAIALSPGDSEIYNNLGISLQEQGKLTAAEDSYRKAIELAPRNAALHYNLGSLLQKQGRLYKAEASYNQALSLKPDYTEVLNNLGNTLQELGRLDEAKASLIKATQLKPDYAEAYWNLIELSKSLDDAEYWVDRCLVADDTFVKAIIIKAALRYFRGDKGAFNKLIESKFQSHPFTRSCSWAFSLTNLPELHFNRWKFFDAVTKKSIISRPFYEFGVWRASSFNYLIKTYKKGFGFDTFTGLPEDWHSAKAGSYSSDGNIPKIRGGEFIEGEFEDTLPVFFSATRPTASIINFDADLYSSTICALNFSKKVMDKDTILIFDEFLMNENWEQDEFKALNEFCTTNRYRYEVIAISFFTKQVAIKLIGI